MWGCFARKTLPQTRITTVIPRNPKIMLSFIFFSLGFLTLAWIYGRLSVRLVAGWAGGMDKDVDWLLTFLMGFVSLTTLANLLSLVIPLSWMAFLILCIGAGLAFSLDVRNQRL